MRIAIPFLLNRSLFIKTYSTPFRFCTAKKGEMFEKDFSELFTKSQKKQKFTSGRSWRTEQLRLKSNQDLHKLWFVCVKQKNLLLADQIIEERFSGSSGDIEKRLVKVKKTMNRILGVINERQVVRRKYREQLQNQYVQKKKDQLQKNLANQQEQQLPEITWEMLRAKYHNLRKGVDNVKYLEKIWEKREEHQGRKQRMNERMENFKLDNFNSFWEYEMNIGERPLQEQVLRAHITNWKSLNLKQRKIILGFLNAKRAKDAKSSFLKELKILGQAIAHQQMKSRIQESK